MQINNNYSVLTPAGSGADVTLTGYILQITGMPPIDIRQIQNCGNGHAVTPVHEKAAIWNINTPASPTASATYGFNMKQITPFVQAAFPGVPQVPGTGTVFANVPHSVSSGGETEAVLTNALTKGANAYLNAGFFFTATDNSTSVDIAATAGYPILELVDASVPPASLTIAQTKVTKAISASTNATPTVITFATLSGSVIVTTANTTYLVYIDAATGGSGISAGYYLARIQSATTAKLYTLGGVAVAGTATSDITGNIVFSMQASAGSVNDLIRQGVNSSLLTTGHVYGQITFNFSQVESGGNDFPSLTYSWVLYVDYTASVANYDAFTAALNTAIPNLFS